MGTARSGGVARSTGAARSCGAIAESAGVDIARSTGFCIARSTTVAERSPPSADKSTPLAMSRPAVCDRSDGPAQRLFVQSPLSQSLPWRQGPPLGLSWQVLFTQRPLAQSEPYRQLPAPMSSLASGGGANPPPEQPASSSAAPAAHALRPTETVYASRMTASSDSWCDKSPQVRSSRLSQLSTGLGSGFLSELWSMLFSSHSRWRAATS